MASKILRTNQVVELTGLSKSTLWRLEHNGEFPSRLRLSCNAVGWLEDDIYAWLESRGRGFEDELVDEDAEDEDIDEESETKDIDGGELDD